MNRKDGKGRVLVIVTLIAVLLAFIVGIIMLWPRDQKYDFADPPMATDSERVQV